MEQGFATEHVAIEQKQFEPTVKEPTDPPDAELMADEDYYQLQILEDLLRRKKPSTFASDPLVQPERWLFPHDPEQWVEVRRLTAAEVRHYQALQMQMVAKLQSARFDTTEIRFRATEAYLYLLRQSITRFRFRKGDRFIEGTQSMNAEQLNKIYSDLTPEVAAWLERKLLVFNELTPAAQRKKANASNI